ncbi:hypothetical protein SLEP1_g18712 [Rubroshorea leprosula]|uniref:Transposase (putative) gypsy type domain-containing protein n=1 Tax=Rubroshorea leprosula TaxID=152421 RepID=A0AAV5JAB8_9ROSI|nr:hypothetical protein SLEP1_g18712 [Rubroshorea leprosula]
MASFHDVRELWGNQARKEEESVILVEPIAMIVPPELQDLPGTITPKSSAGSSAGGDSGKQRSSTSRNSSIEGTPSEAGNEVEGVRSPSSALVATLHHEIADGAATIKGYKRLREMVRDYQIPKTILIRTGTKNKKACSVSATRWVIVYVDHFDTGLHFPLPGLIFDVLAKYELALMQLTPNSIKFIIGFMFLCERLEIPAKVVVFRLLFLCRYAPSPAEQGGEMSNILERQHQRTSLGSKPVSAAAATRLSNVPPAPTRDVANPQPSSAFVSGPRIAYPKGFSYVRTDCQATMNSEMANQAASMESRANELACKVNELRDELKKAQAKRERGIQVAKEEANHAEDRAKRAKSDRDKALYELNSLKDRVAEANQNVAPAEASLEQAKKCHQHVICFARAQGAEWLVGADMFQDAVAVASTNTTTDIYNEIRGKELNEEGVLVWPPSIVEEGEDIEGLLSFDAWVAEPLEVQAEPSSTPPTSQPTIAPALPSPALSCPARPTTTPTDASIPVNLTDD